MEGNAGSGEDLLLIIGLYHRFLCRRKSGAKTRERMIGQYTCQGTIPEVKESTWLLFSVGTVESFEALRIKPRN